MGHPVDHGVISAGAVLSQMKMETKALTGYTTTII